MVSRASAFWEGNYKIGGSNYSAPMGGSQFCVLEDGSDGGIKQEIYPTTSGEFVFSFDYMAQDGNFASYSVEVRLGGFVLGYVNPTSTGIKRHYFVISSSYSQI